MKKWRLEDRDGRTVEIIEAETKSEADLHGLKNHPVRFRRAVDIEVERAKRESAIAKLQEAFKASFLAEGMNEAQAEKLAEIAARGR